MKKRLLICVFTFLTTVLWLPMRADNHDPSDNAGVAINGYIKDASNGEMLIGATIYVHQLQTGTVTNVYGFYSLSLKPGDYLVRISYIGYKTLEKVISISKSRQMNFELEPDNKTLSEVVITEKRGNENITETSMGSTKLNVETIKKIPAFMGEVDVLKTVQMLPGVQTAAEGFSGFSVRGGSTDHNLILLDEATVYNASHLLGFFSVFNSDAIKDMTIYKGDIPAQNGGRLASLLDIRMKDGNMKRYQATAGIGSISSRLTLEGPIVKDKSSFLVSGRRTYADAFLALSNDSLLNNNTLYFYDLNLKANYIINEKNRIYISGYYGRDVFAFREMFNMNWGNATQTLRWNSILSDRIFMNTSLIYSDYQYYMKMGSGSTAYEWKSGITDYSVKSDFTFYSNPRNTIRFGGQATYHTFKPGEVTAIESKTKLIVPDNHSIEYAVYTSNEQKISSKLSMNYGIRLSAYQNIGSAKVFNFDENYNEIGYKEYSKGEIFNTHIGYEPRISGAYVLDSLSSIKASYSRTLQYVQLASNSAAGMPTDIWFPVSPNIKPQISNQASVGYFRNFFDNLLETSVEVYYKEMSNQIDFKDNAQLFFNDKLEAEIRTGIAKSYGVEMMVRKQKGRFNGWVSYTLSKAQRKINEINNGDWYNANYDKPHNFSIVGTYDINKRLNVGLNWVYTSGAPLTLPTGQWIYQDVTVPAYSERNGYRLPDYHRLDISATYKLNKNENARFKNELNVSIFNAYNRKNPFTVYFERDSETNKTQAYKLSMFGIVPSITWNINF